MKNVAPLFFLLLPLLFSCRQEKDDSTTYFGNIVLREDGEFYGNGNKLEGKEVIAGNVLIDDYYGGLNHIQHIREITGNLDLYNLRHENLFFLSNLERVGGTIFIHANSNLKSLEGLEKLQTAGSLWVYFNAQGLDISAIAHIQLTGSLLIKTYAKPTIEPFRNIRILPGSLMVESNPRLKDLSWLPNLEKVSGLLHIASNDSLTSLQGLDKLTQVDSFVHILDNPQLSSIAGLQALRKVEVEFALDGNVQLASLNGLEQLERVRKISIRNTQCTSLQGLEHLLFTNQITIQQNPALSDFCALKPVLLANPLLPLTIDSNLQNPGRPEILQGCP